MRLLMSAPRAVVPKESCSRAFGARIPGRRGQQCGSSIFLSAQEVVLFGLAHLHQHPAQGGLSIGGNRMIRKLRRKFVCISMGMVGLVLLTLVCGLLITTVRHQETICAETLDFALSDRNRILPPRPASRRTDRSRPSSRTALMRRAADRRFRGAAERRGRNRIRLPHQSDATGPGCGNRRAGGAGHR